jgi:hypothetical protein
MHLPERREGRDNGAQEKQTASGERMKNHDVTPFTAPVLALVGFKLHSAVHHLPPGAPEPAVLLQLSMHDHATTPPRQVLANVHIDQDMFESLAQKAALMAGMTRQGALELQQQGQAQAKAVRAKAARAAKKKTP